MSTRSTVVATVFALGLCAAAPADIREFAVASGDWHDVNNWDPPGIPDGDDRVIIPAGFQCFVDDDAVADTIDVEEGALLLITGGRTLTIENDTNNLGGSGADHSIVDGTVLIEGALLYFATGGGAVRANDVTGIGRIEGDRGYIEIGANRVLRNFLGEPGEGIRGDIKSISGEAGSPNNGAFHNAGLVEATGLISLAADMRVTDAPGAVWRIAVRHANMEFNEEALGLKGNFVSIGGGRTFTFNESVKTCGAYVRVDNGTGCPGLALANNVTFRYATFLTTFPNPCANPGTGGGAFDCNNPWEVSSSVSTPTCD